MALAGAITPDGALRRAATRRVVLAPSRSFRRSRPAVVWWAAAAIAIVLNGGLVAALALVSGVQPPIPAPPLAVRHLRQREPERPPPPNAERVPMPAADLPVAMPVAAALPALDLPAVPTADGIALPDTGLADLAIDLPLTMPAFAATAGPEAGEALATGMPACDTPAEREGAFDLERYYPRAARVQGMSGASTVRIAIGADGRVVDVRVLDSSPPGVFEGAAERLARSLRFRAATAAGRPVASVQTTIIAWTLK